MKPLNTYLEYRDWLGDFFKFQQLKEEWSYRFIAAKIHSDAGNLVKVIQKQRHLSVKSLAPLKDLANLSEIEFAYLKTLYQFNKCKKVGESKKLFDQLMGLKYVSPHNVEANSYQYYSEWFHSVVLAIVYLCQNHKTIKMTPANIAKLCQPRINRDQVQKSLNILSDLNMIRPKGATYVVNNTLLSAGESLPAWVIKNYQKQTMELAEKSLNFHKPEEREFGTLTLTLSSEDLDRVKQLTLEYKRKILKVVEQSEMQDRVYQLNLQLFPVSEPLNSFDAEATKSSLKQAGRL